MLIKMEPDSIREIASQLEQKSREMEQLIHQSDELIGRTRDMLSPRLQRDIAIWDDSKKNALISVSALRDYSSVLIELVNQHLRTNQ